MSRRLRPPRGGGAYVPPHLRSGTAAAVAELQAAPGRTLDELAPHNMSIKVEYTQGGPFLLDGCPDNISEQTADKQQQQSAIGEPSNTTIQLACCVLESPACPDDYQTRELLQWFKTASSQPQQPDFPAGDSRAMLSLPAHLSKHERATWHAAAQRKHLNSESTGIGDCRYLRIWPSQSPPQQQQQQQQQQQPVERNWSRLEGSCKMTANAICIASDNHPASAGDAAAAAAATSAGLTADSAKHQRNSWKQQQQQQQQARRPNSSSSSSRPVVSRGEPGWAKQVWYWCQQEGAALEKYSQGEVQQLLAAGEEALPVELAELIKKREASIALVDALSSRDEPAAVALLQQAPESSRLAWVRDSCSGGYPSHVAAWHGLGAFIKQLVEMHGVAILQQHDMARSTPISLAQQRGHKQLAAELEQLRQQAVGCSAAGSTSGSFGVLSSSAGGRGGVTAAGAGRGFGRGRSAAAAAVATRSCSLAVCTEASAVAAAAEDAPYQQR